MRNVHLHGALKKYGETIQLDVDTAGEAVAALCANFPEIMGDFRDGSWHLMRGDPETGLALDEEMVAGLHLGDADLYIMPDVTGAKRGGALKAIIGVALVAVSFGSAGFLAQPISNALIGGLKWGNAIGRMGLVMALSGVSQMLAPEEETEDKEESFLATGPISTGGHSFKDALGMVIAELARIAASKVFGMLWKGSGAAGQGGRGAVRRVVLVLGGRRRRLYRPRCQI